MKTFIALYQLFVTILKMMTGSGPTPARERGRFAYPSLTHQACYDMCILHALCDRSSILTLRPVLISQPRNKTCLTSFSTLGDMDNIENRDCPRSLRLGLFSEKTQPYRISDPVDFALNGAVPFFPVTCVANNFCRAFLNMLCDRSENVTGEDLQNRSIKSFSEKLETQVIENVFKEKISGKLQNFKKAFALKNKFLKKFYEKIKNLKNGFCEKFQIAENILFENVLDKSFSETYQNCENISSANFFKNLRNLKNEFTKTFQISKNVFSEKSCFESSSTSLNGKIGTVPFFPIVIASPNYVGAKPACLTLILMQSGRQSLFFRSFSTVIAYAILNVSTYM